MRTRYQANQEAEAALPRRPRAISSLSIPAEPALPRRLRAHLIDWNTRKVSVHYPNTIE